MIPGGLGGLGDGGAPCHASRSELEIRIFEIKQVLVQIKVENMNI